MESPRRETAVHRPEYPGSGFETRGGPPPGIEQRGTRFPSSWRPDEPVRYQIPEQPSRLETQARGNVREESSSGFFRLPVNRHATTETQTLASAQPATTIQQLIKYQFIYSMTALILQLACMIIGGWLGISGAVGHTSFTAQVLSEIGLKVQMTDAGPGTVLFLVGLLTLPFTRFDVKVDK